MTIRFAPEAAELAALLEARSHRVYAVGGCVRDSLLGRAPKDWDFCTSATPEQVRDCFSAYRLAEIGARHGTIAVLLGGRAYEITTFRADGAYGDGRRPDRVRFVGDLRVDLARRDFTINACACPLGGEVVDLFGGIADLETELVRCVGEPEVRFGEDALRILRALRFASVYGFQVEEQTARAALAGRSLLCRVSAERVGGELVRLLCGPGAGAVVRRFWPVITAVLPGLGAGEGDRRAAAVGAVSPEPALRLAALIGSAPDPEKLLGALRLDRATAGRAVRLARARELPLAPGAPQLLRALNRLGPADLRGLLELRRADDPQGVAGYEEALETLLVGEPCYRVEHLAVRGEDLTALGLAGPEVGEALRLLLSRVLAGELPNRRDALLTAVGTEKIHI